MRRLRARSKIRSRTAAALGTKSISQSSPTFQQHRLPLDRILSDPLEVKQALRADARIACQLLRNVGPVAKNAPTAMAMLATGLRTEQLR